jgi:tetratricopeptide (TPR) repeat protein
VQVELELAAELGYAYQSLRKYGKARACYEKGLELARKMEDHQKLPQILNNLGIVLRGLEEPESSLKFFEDYLEMAAARGDTQGQVAALNNIGLIHLDKGRLGEAENALRQALARSRERSDLPALRSTMVNLGVVLRQQGKIDEAITLYYEALAFSPDTPSEGPYTWQRDLLYLGDAYAAKGWSSAAAACYEAARRISRAARDLLSEKDALEKLGEWASRAAADPGALELAELERLDNELQSSMRSLEEQSA